MACIARRETEPRIELRDAVPSDFPLLLAIDQLCFPPDLAYSAAELRYGMRGKGAVTIVAEQALATESTAFLGENKRQIAGFIVANEDTARRAHIITIDVRPEFRRIGVASQLMRAAEMRMRLFGLRTAVLEAAVNNFAALAFYHRHGYRVVKPLRGYYNGVLDGLLLSKELSEVNDPTSGTNA